MKTEIITFAFFIDTVEARAECGQSNLFRYCDLVRLNTMFVVLNIYWYNSSFYNGM